MCQLDSAGQIEMPAAGTGPQAGCWNLDPLALAAAPETGSAAGSQQMLCYCLRSSGLGRTWALRAQAEGFQH